MAPNSVVVTIEKPDSSALKVNGLDLSVFLEKQKAVSTKQFIGIHLCFFMCLGCFWIKYNKIKPTIAADAYDIEDSSSFPIVLLQIPMCNERELYEQAIASACQKLTLLLMCVGTKGQ